MVGRGAWQKAEFIWSEELRGLPKPFIANGLEPVTLAHTRRSPVSNTFDFCVSDRRALGGQTRPKRITDSAARLHP